MPSETESAKPTFDSIKWPLIVFALLAGHMSIMLVAMAFANAEPPELVEGSPYASAPAAPTQVPSAKP